MHDGVLCRYDKAVYLLSAKASKDNSPNCSMADTANTLEQGRMISALTDVETGDGAINIQCEGNYTATLVVRDAAGAEVTVRSWDFEVLRQDTTVPG